MRATALLTTRSCDRLKHIETIWNPKHGNMSPGLPIKTTWNRITKESRDTTQKEAATAPKVAGEVDETAAKLHCVAQVQPDTLHETEPWLKQASSLGSLWCPYGVLGCTVISPCSSLKLPTENFSFAGWRPLEFVDRLAKPCHAVPLQYIQYCAFASCYCTIYWHILAMCSYYAYLCRGLQTQLHTCLHAYIHSEIHVYIIYIFASSWATTFTPMRVARDTVSIF